jgi:hypothetical protein
LIVSWRWEAAAGSDDAPTARPINAVDRADPDRAAEDPDGRPDDGLTAEPINAVDRADRIRRPKILTGDRATG